MTIYVGNVYNRSTHKGTLIYVGRATSFNKAPNSINLSILGNPFFMKDESQREEVCQKYKQWLRTEYDKKGSVHTAVTIILERSKKEDLTLLCFCHPRSCHAHVLHEFIWELLAN